MPHTGYEQFVVYFNKLSGIRMVDEAQLNEERGLIIIIW